MEVPVAECAKLEIQNRDDQLTHSLECRDCGLDIQNAVIFCSAFIWGSGWG